MERWRDELINERNSLHKNKTKNNTTAIKISTKKGKEKRKSLYDKISSIRVLVSWDEMTNGLSNSITDTDLYYEWLDSFAQNIVLKKQTKNKTHTIYSHCHQ